MPGPELDLPPSARVFEVVLSFEAFFTEMTGLPHPHPWQRRLGADPSARDRLIRVPTGLGKTAGVVAAWLYHRVGRSDRSWPTRLVVVLPMRVLVEQTHREIGAWLARVAPGVRVHLLMGGRCEDEYALGPESPAVLVGTQDMFLSRALLRGYAAGRARWPVDYGLLHRDALWVLDEVQLMDVGLATSAQLAALRSVGLRPTASWWMSATLQPAWFRTVDFAPQVDALWATRTRVVAEERTGGLWSVVKTVRRDASAVEPSAIADLATAGHQAGTLTLVVVNRVERAAEVHKALQRKKPAAELRLVHSRFRGHERRSWAADFLRKNSPMPPAGRIVVATQVVEAGVDVSARLLVTDLAPWPSLVQRFGRAARYAGEVGEIVVVGPGPVEEKSAAPYHPAALQAASAALVGLQGGSVKDLEEHEEGLDASELARLYPYAPAHVLRRPDLLDLFDTTADLSGADLDISRFVRSGEERDLTVFWRQIAGEPGPEVQPHRDELCAVPFLAARKWLDGLEGWRWSYPDGAWLRLDSGAVGRLLPGAVILVQAAAGGYDPERGFDPKSKKPVAPALGGPVGPAVRAFDAGAEGEGSDDLSALSGATEPWKSIGFHGREVGEHAATMGDALGLPSDVRRLLVLAGRWHDHGKAHPGFQRSMQAGGLHRARFGSARGDLAKAPDAAWVAPRARSPRGFRHELASALALFEVLRRADPSHGALRGPWRDLLEHGPDAPDLADHPLASELAALSPDEFDLVAWLVMTHHGKVRCALLPAPGDPEGRVRGVADGEDLPAIEMADPSGSPVWAPAVTLRLDLAQLGLSERYGASWTDRVERLRARWGDAELAWFEAVFRAADVRASMSTTTDPWLTEVAE